MMQAFYKCEQVITVLEVTWLGWAAAAPVSGLNAVCSNAE